MSDECFATGPALPSYCAACFPDLDPRGYIATPCYEHQPEIPRGVDDDRVGPGAPFLYGGAECGGDDNRRWCELLRGPA